MIAIRSRSQLTCAGVLVALCGMSQGCAPSGSGSATSGAPPGSGAAGPPDPPRATAPSDAPDAAAPGLMGSALRLLDVDGNSHALGPNDPRPTAFVFLSPDCPIAREAVPALAALAAATPEPALRVFGVIAGRGVTRADARAFVRAYAIAFPVLLDASGLLADRLRPTVTPEAFVVDADGRVVYRGRVDDTYVALGKRRPAVTSRDLAQAIERARSGAPTRAAVVTPPIGCFVEPERAASAARPTYARDIAPILGAYCADCHRPDGVAPFPLVSLDDARRHADTIVTATRERYMPPLHAVPGVGRFLDQLWLGDPEIELLEAWTKTGLAPGDGADLPPARTFPSAAKWPLGEPDLVLKMPRAYPVPATGDDLYRSFVLGTIPADRMIVAIDIQPGVRQVVHHAGVYQDTQGIARKLEAKSGFGYEGQAMAGLGYGSRLRTWAAGVVPRMLADGMGQPVQKGADLVLELHYRPTGKIEHDQSKVGVYFARRPVQQLVGAVPMVTTDIDIPPDDPYFRVPLEKQIETASTLLSIRPHMHRLGKDLKATAILPSGESIPLLAISHWDYQWQPVYVMSRALPLPAGTVLRLECFFDNSAANPLNPSSPPKRVGFGWKVTEEMCAMYPELAFGSREDLRRWTSMARGSGSMPIVPD